MQQSTAKNLRDLLIKQQMNSKIHFKGEPIKAPIRKQSGTWECQCNQKHCAICARKKVNQSPMIRQQDSKRDIKVGSSISAHQSPNREKQNQLLMNRQPSAKKPLYADNIIYHKSIAENVSFYINIFEILQFDEGIFLILSGKLLLKNVYSNLQQLNINLQQLNPVVQYKLYYTHIDINY